MKIDRLEFALKKIANGLLTSSVHHNNNAVSYGKLGAIIFLLEYGKRQHSQIYEEFADLLLSDIYSSINGQNLLSFSSGLTGVGWGISYLVKNGFIDGDLNSALESFDSEIEVSFKSLNLSDRLYLEKIAGAFTFFLCRFDYNNSTENETLSFHFEELIEQALVSIGKFLSDLLESEKVNFEHEIFLICFIVMDVNRRSRLKRKSVNLLKLLLAEMSSVITYCKLTNFNKIELACFLIEGGHIIENRYYSQLGWDLFYTLKPNLDNILFSSSNPRLDLITSFLFLLSKLSSNTDVPVYPDMQPSMIKKLLTLFDLNRPLYTFVGSPANGFYNIGLCGGVAGLGMLLLSTIEPSSINWACSVQVARSNIFS